MRVMTTRIASLSARFRNARGFVATRLVSTLQSRVPSSAVARLPGNLRLASTTAGQNSTRNGTYVAAALTLAGLIAATSLWRDSVAAEAKPEPAKSESDAKSMEGCLKELKARFTGDQWADDLPTRVSRNHDSMSYYVGGTPQAVVFALSEADVVDAVKICYKYGIPIIPWGAGTSIEGQLTPTDRGGIVVDLSSMSEIVELNIEDMDAVVQAGKSWLDLNAEIAEHGVFFAPDPGPGASLGGMCGTSCSGTRAWRDGTMKENVLGMRVVMSDGRVIKTRRRPPKSSAGYDLTRLFIGSEGTLGIITEVTVKLRRTPPSHQVAVAGFPTIKNAANLVRSIVQSGMILNRLELMDNLAVKAANNFPGGKVKLPEQTTLLIDFAGTTDSIKEQQAQVEKMAKEQGVAFWMVSKNADEYGDIWQIRRNAIYYNFSIRPDRDTVDPRDLALISTDSCVPISKLPEALVEAQKLREEMGIIAPIVAHAGDGNFHCALSVKKTDPNEVEAAKKFQDILSERAILLGGTCTGEHGVGKSKVRFLELELGKEALEIMWSIKRALDPKGIMNPGHTIPDLDTKPHKH